MPKQTERPNIVLFMTDQQRGDCLGIDGHPVLKTPHLDELASSGVRFRRAYSACPICVPARRTLMTGRRAASHGVLSNYNTRLDFPTLPGLLSQAGYQTHLVGKLHLWPLRKLYGFSSADWSDGPYPGPSLGDYGTFLQQQGIDIPDACMAHGTGMDTWIARPWHLEERYHFSNWCADRALSFLDRRDPTVPFFLCVSFFHPHPPYTPPSYYFERYMGMDLPQPPVADWARVFDGAPIGLATDTRRIALDPDTQKRCLAGYYGCINHIDDQIARVLWRFVDRPGRAHFGLSENTVFIFVSDHGDMLGDHQFIKKSLPYEGSARIPFIVRFPECMDVARGQIRNEVVELMDVMPTILDLAGVPIPKTVEGRSIMPLVRGEKVEWRSYLHGECSDVRGMPGGMQFITDGRFKYIWYPAEGREQYFDVENDHKELVDLSHHPRFQADLARWRTVLARELAGRPEGFSDGQELALLHGPTPRYLPAYERKDEEWRKETSDSSAG